MSERPIGLRSEPVAYTPPKYGPPPGVNPQKWRAMSRSARREHLRNLARTLNHVARAPGNRETCEHGQLVGQCTECSKTTGR